MKAKQWINGNRMLFQSGNKTFDRKTNCISTGNVIANTQNSTFIRGKNEIVCNGQTFERGHLQQYDLNQWNHLLDWYVKDRVKFFADQHGKVILYMFKHRVGAKLTIHGFVITDKDHNELARLYSNNRYKSMIVVDEAAKYVTNYQEATQ